MATNPVPDQVDNRVFLPKSSSLLGRCRLALARSPLPVSAVYMGKPSTCKALFLNFFQKSEFHSFWRLSAALSPLNLANTKVGAQI